jgi:hypothetical protein
MNTVTQPTTNDMSEPTAVNAPDSGVHTVASAADELSAKPWAEMTFEEKVRDMYGSPKQAIGGALQMLWVCIAASESGAARDEIVATLIRCHSLIEAGLSALSDGANAAGANGDGSDRVASVDVHEWAQWLRSDLDRIVAASTSMRLDLGNHADGGRFAPYLDVVDKAAASARGTYLEMLRTVQEGDLANKSAHAGA